MDTGLSLEFILQSARNYVAGRHKAYMAEHGSDPKRNHRLDRPWQATSQIDAVQWYEGWADERSEDAVVSGNWNTVDEYRPPADGSGSGTREMVPGGDVMERLERIFEKMGLDIAWCDETTSCGSCGKAIQTGPDCYSWQPDYVISDGDITCGACMEDAWEDELAALCHSRGTLNNRDVDPSQYGYRPVVKLVCGFSGWHDGDRCKRELEAVGVGLGFFFQVVSTEQFGASAVVWVERDAETPDDLHGDHDVDEYDNAPHEDAAEEA